MYCERCCDCEVCFDLTELLADDTGLGSAALYADRPADSEDMDDCSSGCWLIKNVDE